LKQPPRSCPISSLAPSHQLHTVPPRVDPPPSPEFEACVLTVRALPSPSRFSRECIRLVHPFPVLLGNIYFPRCQPRALVMGSLPQLRVSARLISFISCRGALLRRPFFPPLALPTAFLPKPIPHCVFLISVTLVFFYCVPVRSHQRTRCPPPGWGRRLFRLPLCSLSRRACGYVLFLFIHSLKAVFTFPFPVVGRCPKSPPRSVLFPLM